MALKLKFFNVWIFFFVLGFKDFFYKVFKLMFLIFISLKCILFFGLMIKFLLGLI